MASHIVTQSLREEFTEASAPFFADDMVDLDLMRVNRLLEDYVTMDFVGATWVRLYRSFLVFGEDEVTLNNSLYGNGLLHLNRSGKVLLERAVLQHIDMALRYRASFAA